MRPPLQIVCPPMATAHFFVCAATACTYTHAPARLRLWARAIFTLSNAKTRFRLFLISLTPLFNSWHVKWYFLHFFMAIQDWKYHTDNSTISHCPHHGNFLICTLFIPCLQFDCSFFCFRNLDSYESCIESISCMKYRDPSFNQVHIAIGKANMYRYMCTSDYRTSKI